MTSFIRNTAIATATIVALGAFPQTQAQARDFFSTLFGGLTGGRSSAPSAPTMTMPFATEFGDQPQQPRVATGGGSAYCVRTCDGRYFPITGAGAQSKAETCKSFCPASETKIVYGTNIDSAYTDSGKAYSDMPNAFRYRTELVSGCTCNGKDAGGLARVNIEQDATMRRGDLVAGPNGLVVASKTSGIKRDGRGASLNYTPVSNTSRVDRKLPVIAQQ